MNPGEGYRLLEYGETILPGDEFLSVMGSWRGAVSIGRVYDDGHNAHRRKLPAPAEENADTFFRPSGWVSVKERLPSEPGRVLAINHSDGRAHCTTWNGQWFALNPKPYAWMPIPPPPAPPKSDAEIAWENYVERTSLSGKSQFADLKAAFIAGFNAEVSK